MRRLLITAVLTVMGPDVQAQAVEVKVYPNTPEGRAQREADAQAKARHRAEDFINEFQTRKNEKRIAGEAAKWKDKTWSKSVSDKAQNNELREWSRKEKGKKVKFKARFAFMTRDDGFLPDTATFVGENDEVFPLALRHLGTADQNWIKAKDKKDNLERQKQAKKDQAEVKKKAIEAKAAVKNDTTVAVVAEPADEKLGPTRTWTIAKDGEQFRGQFAGIGTTTLKDGTKIEEVMILREGAYSQTGVTPSRLSEEDQRWVQDELKRREESAKLNKPGD